MDDHHPASHPELNAGEPLRPPVREPAWPVVDQYLAGHASPEERAEVERWLASVPEAGMEIEALYRAVRDADPAREPISTPDIAVRATAVLQRHTPQSQRNPALPRHRRTIPVSPSVTTRWGHHGIVAALVIIAVVSSVLLFRSSNRERAVSSQSYATTSGQRADITLSDGSHVHLAPRTRLLVEAGFGKTTRTVTLSGEAYFDVRTDGSNATRAPFVVRTGVVTTRVLGTAFDIRHYHDDSSIRVAVVSGKVMTAGRGAPVTLVAGNVAHVTDSGATTATVADLQPYVGWTQGTLVFEDAPVPVVLAAVGHWYGYEFRLADPTLATQHLTATLHIANQSETMMTVKRLLDVTMTFEDTVITLRPNGRTGRTDSIRMPKLRRERAEPIPRMEVGR